MDCIVLESLHLTLRVTMRKFMRMQLIESRAWITHYLTSTPTELLWLIRMQNICTLLFFNVFYNFQVCAAALSAITTLFCKENLKPDVLEMISHLENVIYRFIDSACNVSRNQVGALSLSFEGNCSYLRKHCTCRSHDSMHEFYKKLVLFHIQFSVLWWIFC